MTYRKNQTEYLDWEEWQVMSVIKQLVAEGRTGNNSQIAAITGLSRTRVATITRNLCARSYLRNAGKGAAYHWRCTAKTPLLETAENGAVK